MLSIVNLSSVVNKIYRVVQSVYRTTGQELYKCSVLGLNPIQDSSFFIMYCSTLNVCICMLCLTSFLSCMDMHAEHGKRQAISTIFTNHYMEVDSNVSNTL